MRRWWARQTGVEAEAWSDGRTVQERVGGEAGVSVRAGAGGSSPVAASITWFTDASSSTVSAKLLLP